jgi:hypothetical protein
MRIKRNITFRAMLKGLRLCACRASGAGKARGKRRT